MGVFTYSDVDTATSFARQEKAPEEIKTERKNTLMELQREISARKLRSHVGRTEIALMEGPSAESEWLWQARLEGMAPDIDGKVYVNDVVLAGGNSIESERLPQAGDLVHVEITEAHDYDLVGRVTGIARRAGRPALDTEARKVATSAPVHRIATGAALRILQ